jgi:hypothetical protein
MAGMRSWIKRAGGSILPGLILMVLAARSTAADEPSPPRASPPPSPVPSVSHALPAPTPTAEETSAIIFSTYLGGTGRDTVTGITVDRDWEVYVCGSTSSVDFPSLSPYQGPLCGTKASDAFAAKLSSTGSSILWSVYLGEIGGECEPLSILADATERVYLSGVAKGGTAEAFAAKLDSAGSSLLYAAFIGGSGADGCLGAGLDQHGCLFLAGATASGDFPTAGDGRSAGGTGSEAFVAKLASGGSALIFSTALAPGRAREAVIFEENAVVIGESRSREFPTRNPRPLERIGEGEPFVAALSQATGETTYAACLGDAGATDGLSLDLDSEGGLYAIGASLPSDFPSRAGSWSEAVDSDVWLGKFSADSSPLAFTVFLGGRGNERGAEVVSDWRKNIWVAGSTDSDNFPTAAPAQASRAGGRDAFLSCVSSAGGDLLFSTYWGGAGEEESFGSWADQDACVYICGRTTSENFPTINARQAASGGGEDGFAAKFRPPPPPGETFIDRQYHKLSQMVSRTVYQFDSFFGEQIVEEEIDTPWIRVRGSVEIKERLKLDFAQHFSANLPLPILERRLHTFFGSDADDDLGTDSDYRDPTEDKHFTAGLRYYLHQIAELKPSLSGGVEWSGKPVVYVKPRLEWDHSDDPWYLQSIQYLYWYSDDGLGETTRFIANRLLDRHWLTRGESEVIYSNTSSGVDLSQGFDLRYLDFSLEGMDHFAASLEWVSKAHTWPCFRADSHTLTLRLRHSIWREWLRLEVAPRLTWKRIDPDEGESYWENASPSVFLILEVMFEEER